MGASKRAAEMLVLRAAKRAEKALVVVRFGNVLAVEAALYNLQRQIAAGGPVTITIRRFVVIS